MRVALQAALVIAFTGPLVFMLGYTKLTKGGSWFDSIGLTLQLEALFLAVQFALLLSSTWWHYDPLATKVGAWCLISFWAINGLVMYWRTIVFFREGRKGGLGEVEDSGRSRGGRHRPRGVDGPEAD